MAKRLPGRAQGSAVSWSAGSVQRIWDCQKLNGLLHSFFFFPTVEFTAVVIMDAGMVCEQ